MGENTITIAQLEHALGVKITVDPDRYGFSGIHLAPGDSMEINVRLILTGEERR